MSTKASEECGKNCASAFVLSLAARALEIGGLFSVVTA